MEAIPYILEGEILEVLDPIPGAPYYRYVCSVVLDTGRTMVVDNVYQSSFLGGIESYHRLRARPRSDAKFDNPDDSQEGYNASVGDRVYIAFVGGNISHPVIISYKQHPNQTPEDESDTESDYSVTQCFGVRQLIDSSGQFRLIHKGNPDIEFKPKQNSLLGSGLSAASSLVGSATGPSSKIVGKSNPAINPADKDEITLLEFLDGGIFRVRDAKGGVIELDHSSDRVYLATEGLKSYEDPDKPFTESELTTDFISLNRSDKAIYLSARNDLNFYSGDTKTELINGDATVEIKGSLDSSVLGDVTESVSGDVSTEITGSLDLQASNTTIELAKLSVKVNGVAEYSISGNWTVDAKGATSIKGSGNAAMKLANGKVAIGGASAELLDLFDKTLQEIDNILKAIQQLTVATAVGSSSPPINLASFVQSSVQVAAIKTQLGTIKGSL